jgi:capsular polysaccharide transport system permease protein
MGGTMIRPDDQEERTRVAPAIPAANLPSLFIRHVLEPLRRHIPDRSLAPAQTDADGTIIVEERLRAWRQLSPALLSFIVVVLVPAAISAMYLIFVASDQFTSETRFAVRPAEQDSSSSQDKEKDKLQNVLAPASSGAGNLPNLASQDAEIVASYIRSPSIINDLSGTIDICAIFHRPGADFWARLTSDPSREDLRDYWLKMVSTYIDNSSGIVTVQVRAFRPSDALALTQAILKSSDHLVNSLSMRAREDAMRRAEEEVRRTDGQMRSIFVDLARYRDAEGFIDPEKMAEQTGKLLVQLMSEKIQIESELYVTKGSGAADAPGTSSLQTRLESVNGQIAQVRSQLAGNSPERRNLADSLVHFEELEVKRQFAETMYNFARDGLDRARHAAERQTVYLTVFVPPELPQDYSYPLRFTFIALISIGLMITWGTGAMMWASIQDHRL